MFSRLNVLEERLNKYLLFCKKTLGFILIIFYIGGFSLTLIHVLNPADFLAGTSTGSVIGWPLIFVKETSAGGDIE